MGLLEDPALARVGGHLVWAVGSSLLLTAVVTTASPYLAPTVCQILSFARYVCQLI